MITKNVNLYLGDGFPVRIPVSQYDTMWQFVFEIIHNSQPWQIPTGATAVLNGKKPDGNVFAFAGTIENNAVTVDADVQMTAVAGQTVCELSILADGKTVGTANFILDVEEAPKSADDVVSDTVLDGYGMMVTNAVDDYIARHPEVFGGDKFTQSAKNALLALLEKVAYIDENGQTYIDALESELFPPASLVSITAVFNQGDNAIYDTDSLDTLKQYLTVTANMSDGTTQTVSNYTLSGTLMEGTSTITVSYGGKTTTFNVTVTKRSSIIDDGTYTFATTGETVTITNGNHFAITLNASASDNVTGNLINLSDLAKNGLSSVSGSNNVAVNNLSDVLYTFPANAEVTLKLLNPTLSRTDVIANVSKGQLVFSFRKTGDSTTVIAGGVGFPLSSQGGGNKFVNTVTFAEATEASCLFLYYVYSNDVTFEFDLEMTVNGEKVI